MGLNIASTQSALADHFIRHLTDLKMRKYEGVEDARPAKEDAFRKGFDLATPIAESVLEEINHLLLEDSGTVRTLHPTDDGKGGLFGMWSVTWPLLEATVDKFTNQPMPPVRIPVIFSTRFFHPHIGLMRVDEIDSAVVDADRQNVLCAWPFQVTSAEDAAHLTPVFWTIALGDLHERTTHALGGARKVLPDYEVPASWGHAAN